MIWAEPRGTGINDVDLVLVCSRWIASLLVQRGGIVQPKNRILKNSRSGGRV